MDGAVVAVAVGIDVEADVEIPAEVGTVLQTAELEAAAGDAVPAAAALAIFLQQPGDLRL